VTFRQQVGPSASASQLRRLQELLGDAGYADIRSARGPLGLTQRQGLGKFTSTEAEVLIERLQRDAEETGDVRLEPSAPASVADRPLKDASTESLIAELQERGWRCSRR
jgi:hypothetical protein